MKYAYTNAEGLLCIVTAAPKAALERVLGPLTDEAYRAHVLERSIPDGASNVTALPEDWSAPIDRGFRDAWRLKGRQVEIDMGKARNLHRDRLRGQRATRLAELDVAAVRGLESGHPLTEIAAKKQRLRDAPAHPAIDAAQTPEQLAAISLDDLI